MNYSAAVVKLTTLYPAVGAAIEKNSIEPSGNKVIDYVISETLSRLIAMDRAMDALTAAYANVHTLRNAAGAVVEEDARLTAIMSLLSPIEHGFKEGQKTSTIMAEVIRWANESLVTANSPTSSSMVDNASTVAMFIAHQQNARNVQRFSF